jgi:triacylglycerol esterase/lipase EstA (alpha/beta hydrolase family)
MPDLMWSTYSGVGVGKVSFICHSIGGLVARSCLEDPMMEPLLPLMYTFVSLATPHLGTLFQDSQVVSAGRFEL